MKTIRNKPITSQQLKALHATFHRIGMDEDARHGCIYEFTCGRTASSRELTMHEARQLLERLNPQDELARIERLEQWTGLRRKAAPGDCTPLPLPDDADMDDLMKQNEACRYLACGKNTIKGYASRGLVHSYKKGKFTYYSRRELDKKIRKLRDAL